MSVAVIFCGGTGQLLGYRYLQAYLLGLLNHKPDAIKFVDTDEVAPFVKHLVDFIKNINFKDKEGEGPLGPVPRVDIILLNPGNSQSNVGQALTGTEYWQTQTIHPVHAFFSRDTLNQNIQAGLFARPALGNIFFFHQFQTATEFEPLKPHFTTGNVVVAGSVLGGTGGGVMPLVLSRLHQTQKEQKTNWCLRGLFFGRYFRAQEDRIQGGEGRLRSNEIFTLKAIIEGLPFLQQYYYHTADNLITRDTSREKNDEPLPWPETETDPFWYALGALQHLSNDTTRDIRDEPYDREIIRVDTGNQLDLKKALESHKRSHTRLRAFNCRKILVRAARDSGAKGIWGYDFIEFLKAYKAIAIEIDEERARKRFLYDLQNKTCDLETKVVNRSFPQSGGGHPKPGKITRGIGSWPTNIRDYTPARYPSYDRVIEEAAHTIVFKLMRGTE